MVPHRGARGCAISVYPTPWPPTCSGVLPSWCTIEVAAWNGLTSLLMLPKNGAMESPGSHSVGLSIRTMTFGLLSVVRHKHLCGVCLKPGDTFPGGFYTEAMYEHCIATYGITPIQHCPYGVQLQEALCASYGIPREQWYPLRH